MFHFCLFVFDMNSNLAGLLQTKHLRTAIEVSKSKCNNGVVMEHTGILSNRLVCCMYSCRCRRHRRRRPYRLQTNRLTDYRVFV